LEGFSIVLAKFMGMADKIPLKPNPFIGGGSGGPTENIVQINRNIHNPPEVKLGE
jgi:hypothetical protein